MIHGIRDYLAGVLAILASAPLRAWLWSVVWRGALLGMLVLVSTATIGAWWISTLGESRWFDFGALLSIFVLLYFSGAIFGLVMALGVPLFIREKQLVRALSGAVELQKSRVALGDHAREVSSSLVSVLISVLAWPFLIIPVLLPIGVTMLAWAYAREAGATSTRIAKEYAVHVQATRAEPTRAYNLGLGLVPTVLSLIPFVAFLAWPTLLVGGLRRTSGNSFD
ncbi:MAG TPA: hypothetical protein VM901_03125 [Bdellovibrionota bacterium]|jgi:hypothetical protein|nr:hypothetical protein [Bdellovibrionota bacterium]